MEMGRQIMAGLAVGAEQGQPGVLAAVAAPTRFVSSSSTTSPTVNLSFGDTAINNGMDAALFRQEVVYAVKHALRYGG
jgi:hypothetical protein